MPRSREETAELVGRYFGLQSAGNMRVFAPNAADAGAVSWTVNALREMIQEDMDEIVKKLPPGTIDAWPRDPV